jgi:hypothetical protein
VPLLAIVVLAGACTAALPDPSGAAPSGSNSSTMAAPLPAFDADSMRTLEANLRRSGRESAELAKLDPTAVELAGLMDRTASFALSGLPAAMKSQLSSTKSDGGRKVLAAPLPGLSPPAGGTLGAYLMTTIVFEAALEKAYETGARSGEGYRDGTKCPCKGAFGDPPTTDTVTIDGNKGVITTTTTSAITWGGGGKVSFDLSVKVDGEVFSPSGVFLYRIRMETTGHADGDVCPDASGIARAKLSFGGREDYYQANGTKTGKGVIEGFSGDLRIKADDSGVLSGVDISTSGGLDAGALSQQLGAEMIRMAAARLAPAFEKAWRSGVCIEVQVSPAGGDVEKDSETTVTAKVKHRIDGTELDKPVEATFGGVKSIDPVNKKQKAPATFKFIAGPKDGDRGNVTFESVSNRGIGRVTVTFAVGGGWTINASGASNETAVGGITNNLRISIKDLKVTAGKDGTLSGTGAMTVSGTSRSNTGPITCTGPIEEKTVKIGVTGTLVGTTPGAILKLTLVTDEDPNWLVAMTCIVLGRTVKNPATPQAHIGFYRQLLGEFSLPADGGTEVHEGKIVFGTALSVEGYGEFIIVRGKG